MSFTGLRLTNDGKEQLTKSIGESVLKFSHIVLGDGNYNGSLTSKKALEHEVMRLPIQYVSRKNDEVVIQADWQSQDVSAAFYFREIGVIGNGKLCYYDNAGEDAEWIDPENANVTSSRRQRITLKVSDEVNVEIFTASGLYALAEEVNQLFADFDKRKLNKTGDASDTIVFIEEAKTRENIASREKLSVIFGKIMKWFADLKAVAFSGSYKDLKDKPTADDIGAISTKQLTDENLDDIKTAGFYYAVGGNTVSSKPSGVNHFGLMCMRSANSTYTQILYDSGNDKEYKRHYDSASWTSWEQTVTGIKGGAESTYRTGDVNITPANIGLGNVPNVATNNQTPTFSQASSRSNISSGEKLSVIFGKIMKWFADLKSVAFSGNYNDLSNRPTIPTTMKGATTSAAGTSGLVPVPAKGAANRYLRSDGTWQVPPNTTYGLATQSVNGLLSSTDKKKIDNMGNDYLAKSTSIGAVTATSAQSGTIYEGQKFSNFDEIQAYVYVIPQASGSVKICVGSVSMPYAYYNSLDNIYIPIITLNNGNTPGHVSINVGSHTARISSMAGVDKWGIDFYGIK